MKSPILFYSGAAFESDKEDSRLAGAQGYLVKPVDNNTLVAEVARLIAEWKDRDTRQVSCARQRLTL